MALTTEQKQKNKDARKLRDGAFNKRFSLYMDAKDSVELELKSSPEFEAKELRSKEMEAIRVAKEIMQSALKAQIAELESKITQIEVTQRPLINEANDKRKQALDAYFKVRSSRIDALNEQFKDVLSANGSAAGWKPVEAFAN
jgi:hypothetical protein